MVDPIFEIALWIRCRHPVRPCLPSPTA
jgi:hypothetical protein